MKTLSPYSKSVAILHVKSPVIKRWPNLTVAEKLKGGIRSAGKRHGRAVTVNLSPAFERLLKRSKSPMRDVGKRMNEALNRQGIRNLPVLLVLEAAKETGRLHLHGVFIPENYPLALIRLAMRHAVGFVPGRPGATQFHQIALYAPDGWYDYITKLVCRIDRLLNAAEIRRLSWMSRPITQIARSDQDATYLVVPENLTTMPETRAV